MTSLTTLVALVPLWLFGGEVIRGFTIIMIWGVVIGTYSTIYIATPVLHYLNLRTAADKAQPAAHSRRADGPAMEGSTAGRARPQVVQAYRGGGFTIAGTAPRLGPGLSRPCAELGAPAPEEIALATGSGTPAVSQPVPDILVIGHGCSSSAPLPAELRQAVRAWGIAVEAMATPAACRTYNLLLAEGRRVAAALIALPACPPGGEERRGPVRKSRRCCASGRRRARRRLPQSRLTLLAVLTIRVR